MATPTLTPAPSSNQPHGYKSWSRKRKILTWTGGTFGALFLVGTISSAVNPAKPTATVAHVTQSAPAKPAPVVTHTVTAAPKPAVTVTHTAAPAAAPAATPAAAAAPAAPPADQIIARFSGTGAGNTGSFTGEDLAHAGAEVVLGSLDGFPGWYRSL